MSTKYKVPNTRGWYDVLEEIGSAFARWGINDWSAQPNVPLARVNSKSLTSGERTVTVRFMKGDREVVLVSDTQDSATGNLKLIQLCVDDMRMIERRGLAETMQSAYMQLAAPVTERDPYEVLGLRPGASPDEVEAMYRVRAKSAHPDRGGSNEAMAELNSARDQLLTAVRS